MDYTELWTKRTSNHTNKKIEKNKIKGKGCRKENGRKKKKEIRLLGLRMIYEKQKTKRNICWFFKS